LWKRQTCGHCKHGYMNQIENDQVLRCCKGCGEIFYCGKRCQKIHWNSVHRHQCNRYWLDKAGYLKQNWFYL
ncbi:MAG: hypothetical protein GY755_23315, partial [Chloroflexi bacterium]|nr:hypothetical protein [Chloroflexota bacterium]